MSQTYDCRSSYAATLADLARRDPNVVVIVNDSVGSSKLDGFVKEFPGQTVNVGIAEQNMVGVSAGLANGGKVPFVSGAGCFLTGRAMEQVKADLAYSNYHVVLCAQSPGMAYGPLGATHHSIEDVAWMRALPGMTVIVPADPAETEQAVRWAYGHDGPVYIRISRMPVPAVHPDDYVFAPGKAVVLRDGSDLTIAANGTVLHRALAAADALAADGIQARVLSVASVKPLDEDAILAAARETGGIVTVEEGLIAGGLGGAVAELVSRDHPTRVRSLGVPDTFAPTGSTGWLFEHFGLTVEGIADAARGLVATRKAA
ncbi:MAG TPA: transketolase C-terminal domain-containing protein [Propionicimonas sp.]|nr:transketolase C-terminal domain-containing protein [Propionicimonas sp.]HRA06508.1 transketolase C-terminal domain-containing protein [Propionicimonas sp.]